MSGSMLLAAYGAFLSTMVAVVQVRAYRNEHTVQLRFGRIGEGSELDTLEVLLENPNRRPITIGKITARLAMARVGDRDGGLREELKPLHEPLPLTIPARSRYDLHVSVALDRSAGAVGASSTFEGANLLDFGIVIEVATDRGDVFSSPPLRKTTTLVVGEQRRRRIYARWYHRAWWKARRILGLRDLD
jgi:hypothetical protein